jgi:methyl-accepting chemotaxis protein
MPDPLGITDGVKSVTKSINESVKASQELSKSIENVLEVANKAAKERTESRKKARQINPDTTTIIEAIDEWQKLLIARQSETRIQEEITKKYGSKAWEEIQSIKARKKWEERQDKYLEQHDRRVMKSVMLLCYMFAAWIAYECTWGSWK